MTGITKAGPPRVRWARTQAAFMSVTAPGYFTCIRPIMSRQPAQLVRREIT